MLTTLVAGLTTGAIYAFVALGYNITHIASRALNFAHANLIVLGMFFSAAWLADGLPTPAVVLLGALAVAGVALVEERLAIRPLRNRAAHSELVTTLGVSSILTGLIIIVWGADPIPVPPVVPEASFLLLGARIDLNDLAILGVVAAITVGLVLLFRRTTFGIAALAQNEDPEAATLRGIDVRRLSLWGFALAGLVAGAVAGIIGHATFAVATLSLTLAIKGFVALTLGGVGSFGGALIGGLVIGVLEALTARYLGAEFRDIAVFLIFVAILLIRPHGLFGRVQTRMV